MHNVVEKFSLGLNLLFSISEGKHTFTMAMIVVSKPENGGGDDLKPGQGLVPLERGWCPLEKQGSMQQTGTWVKVSPPGVGCILLSAGKVFPVNNKFQLKASLWSVMECCLRM